jgi:oligosaccharyltransferase complex subunit gamma
MKIYNIGVTSLFCLGALAAKAPAVDKFKTYHSRSLSSTPLDIDDSTYENLTSAPRDYSIAVLLTAAEAKFGCKLCRDFAPEWELVARSWNKGDKKGDSRVLFSTLDFSKGKNTFQKVCRPRVLRVRVLLMSDS